MHVDPPSLLFRGVSLPIRGDSSDASRWADKKLRRAGETSAGKAQIRSSLSETRWRCCPILDDRLRLFYRRSWWLQVEVAGEDAREMTDADVLRLSQTDKLAEGMRRALPHLQGEARSIVEAMLQPGTVVIVTGTLLVWGGSHLFGVGELVDLVLLAVGVIGIGFAVFDGAGGSVRKFV